MHSEVWRKDGVFRRWFGGVPTVELALIFCPPVLQRVLQQYAAKLLARLPKTAAGGTTGQAAAGTQVSTPSKTFLDPQIMTLCSACMSGSLFTSPTSKEGFPAAHNGGKQPFKCTCCDRRTAWLTNALLTQ